MAFVKVSAGQSMAVRFPDRLWSPIVGNCEDQAAQLTERLRGTVAYAHIHTDGAHVHHGSQHSARGTQGPRRAAIPRTCAIAHIHVRTRAHTMRITMAGYVACAGL